MDPDEARDLLAVGPGATDADVRSAFRRLVRIHHPDVAGGDGTTARLLTEAYRTLLDAEHEGEHDSGGDVVVTAIDDDALTLALPPDEAFLVLLDAATTLGAVTTADPETGLLDVLVSFDDGTTATVLLSLQGRAATGSTDAFVTVEPPDRRTPTIAALHDAIRTG